MSNIDFETMAAVERTCEEEINYMLGAGAEDFDIDRALQDGQQMDEKAMAAAALGKLSGGVYQPNAIDAALQEDLEDDLKFDGITFEQNNEEFTGMPGLTGFASMPTQGFNSDTFQFGKFNYPPPPPVFNNIPFSGFHNTGFNNTGFSSTGFNNNTGFNHTGFNDIGFQNTGFQNTGFQNIVMPPMFPAPFPSDLEYDRFPSTLAGMQANMFSSGMVDDCGLQNPSMAAGIIPPSDLDLVMHAKMSSFEPSSDMEPHKRRPLKKRRVEKKTVGSPARPSQCDDASTEKQAFGPFHWVPIKQNAILDMSESAVAAREARKIRRMKRAKGHVVHLLGTTVHEIEEAAVVDADYNDLYDFSQTQDEQCEDLLRDYVQNFDAKTFVEGAWDGIYLALTTPQKTKNEVQKVQAASSTNSPSTDSVAANLIELMRRKPGFGCSVDGVSSDLSSSSTSKPPQNNATVSCKPESPKSQVISKTNIVTPIGSSIASTKKSLDENVISRAQLSLPLVPTIGNSNPAPPLPPSAPATKPAPSTSCANNAKEPQKGEMNAYADLPDGSDPESRRLRRLMRNRLSAQRSRDKRKKEIEVYTKLKAQKVEEIASLKQTVAEEREGLRRLEELVNFAKSFLGPDKFATVVSN